MKTVFTKLLLVICMVQSACTATHPGYSAANAHSHNDYENPDAFYLAYRSGFGSIEADVFPVNNILYVAHGKKDILPARTLTDMYIKPIEAAFATDSVRRLDLLVDIKENYLITLPILVRELEHLRPWLSRVGAPNRLTILVSGDRPPPSEYKNYPDYIFFDDDLKLPHTADQWKRVGLVSLPFNRISAWKGTEPLPRQDKELLRHKIDSVHGAGKLIRFWAAPDTEKAWKQQQKLHVDLIGTDKIAELASLLQRKN